MLLFAAQKLARPRHLSTLTKGAWAFDTIVIATASFQMTRLLSSSGDLILLSFLSQTQRAIVSPTCSLLSASTGWRTAKAVCWGRWYEKAKLIPNHRLSRTEIQGPRLVILSFLSEGYLVGMA